MKPGSFKQLSLILGLALLVWSAVPAFAGYSFQTVTNPGDPNFTQLLGINNASVIAGYYGDGTVVPNNGFTLTLPSSFTPQNFPGSTQTQVVGINNAGNTAGFYIDVAGVTHGFIKIGGTFSTRDAPGTAFTQLLGLNDSSLAAGYSSTDPTGATLQQAFTYNTGSFTYLTSTLPSGVLNNQATGINNAGDVSGFYEDSAGFFHGFLLPNGGSISTLDFPGSTLTQALGLNNQGQVVGFYNDSGGLMHGFLFKGGFYQSIDEPSGVGTTTINGINDLGQIVGFFVDSNDNTIGFVGTPTPLPPSFLLLGSGLLGLAGWRKFRNS